MPPPAVLSDQQLLCAHARALRESLRLTDLRLILHAPGQLFAGTEEHDRQLAGGLGYAALAGSDLIVYHGAQVPSDCTGVRARLQDELRSLHRLSARAAQLGVRIAIENLAPIYPGPAHVSHDPAAISQLVRSIDSEYVGICLDVGHAHIASGLAGCELVELIEPVLEHVILFEVHDNFGSRADAPRAGGIEPLRLDLHLAPGAGSVPWALLAPLLAAHGAPIQLENDHVQRPAPATLATVMGELLGLGAGARIAV